VKISHKVPLATSAVIVLAFSLFAWTQYHTVQNALYERTENRINEATVALSHQITNWLNGKLAIIDMMAQTISDDFSEEAIQATMDRPVLEQEFILMFGGLDHDGQPISNNPDWNPGEGWDARVRPWYDRARNHNRAILTDPYADSATNDILISAVASIYDGRKFKGAFGGDLSLKTVSDAVNTLNFNGTGYAFLLNSKGEIISHPDTRFNGKPISALFTEKQPRLSSELQELELGDTSVMTSYRRLRGLFGSNWMIGVVLEKEKVMAEAYTLSRNAILGAVASAIVASLVLYIMMGHLVLNPVARLTGIAEGISRGQTDAEIEGTDRKDEIGALAKAIKRMDTSLQITMDRLRER